MKIGTETGSLINHLMSNKTIKDIVIGETPATYLSYSDRYPATVVETFEKGKFNYVVIQLDKYVRTDNYGFSDVQEYEYSRDPEGSRYTFRVTDKGFVSVYEDSETKRFKKGSGGLCIGVRERYYDFTR